MNGVSPGLAEVLLALREHDGIDLRSYSAAVLERRLNEHLAARSLDVAALLPQLETDADARAALLRSLRVGTTAFFRDRPVFEALADTVLPSLHLERPARAWVIGCSTGEEAWSLAAVLSAVVGDHHVVASDVDAARVAAAARGVYAAELGDVDDAWRSCFFVDDGVVSPSDDVRARVDFAVHDVLGKSVAPAVAVVASFDVVFFRNVLIYLKRAAREQVLERLARVVVGGGALAVGAAESLDDDGPFVPWPGVAPQTRIYQRVP